MDNIEDKKNNLEIMRQSFIALMNVVMQLPSAQIQKQQALLRFDEAHMWMQNGIMSYVEPEAPKPLTDAPVEQPAPDHHAIVPNCVDEPIEQTAVA